MSSRFARILRALDTEERILAAAALGALFSVFLPWLSGEWLGGDTVSFSGIRFYTSLIGIAIALLHGSIFTLTVLPALSRTHPPRYDGYAALRFIMALVATVLSLAALSVLVRITYEFPRMSIHAGVYLTFIGSLICTFYAWWAQRKQEDHNTRHDATRREETLEPPPPPPMDDHRLR